MTSSTWMRGCLGALLVAPLACGAGDREIGEAQGEAEEEIIGGFPVTGSRYQAVGALVFPSGDGTSWPFCSGTLIAPTMVLTAEHCVLGLEGGGFGFAIGYDAVRTTRVVPARGAAAEQTVSGGVMGLGADIAIAHLAEAVEDVTPLPFDALDRGRVGDRLVNVGYGVQDNLYTFGTRQGGSMVLRGIGGRFFENLWGSFEGFLEHAREVFPWLDPSDPDDLAELRAYYDDFTLLDPFEAQLGHGEGDAQACFGDSGGPIIARQDGAPTVFGVTSWGFSSVELVCNFGEVIAALEPVTLDFIAYQTACPLIPREGMCADLVTAVRCATLEEGGYRELRTDCGELGLICGRDDSGQIACVPDPCEGIPPEGRCEGDLAIRCAREGEGPRRRLETDCGELGQTCGVDPELREVACVDVGDP